MISFVALLLPAGAIAGSSTEATGSVSAAMLEQIRTSEKRLSTLGFRLATQNAALCDRTGPAIGVQWHSIDQYAPKVRAAVQRHFNMATSLSALALVSGGPADRAGLREDDALVAAAGYSPQSLDEAMDEPATTRQLRAVDHVVAAAAAGPIPVDIVRNGSRIDMSIEPATACASRFELKIDESYAASADGEMVQIGSRFLDEYPDRLIAAVVAHELAHNILHHRERLEAVGVQFGILSGFGSSVRYFRRSEIEADILSLYLLHNAGFDPAVAIQFWERHGPSGLSSILRSRSHPHWRDRIATLRSELGKLRALSAERAGPLIPSLLGTRDSQLSGDWQAILRKHR